MLGVAGTCVANEDVMELMNRDSWSVAKRLSLYLPLVEMTSFCSSCVLPRPKHVPSFALTFLEIGILHWKDQW